jgi:hypothetical protein
LSYYKPAADITSDGGHKARGQWMLANGVTGMSVSPDGSVRLTYDDGREISGMACDLLPAHLRPK